MRHSIILAMGDLTNLEIFDEPPTDVLGDILKDLITCAGLVPQTNLPKNTQSVLLVKLIQASAKTGELMQQAKNSLEH